MSYSPNTDGEAPEAGIVPAWPLEEGAKDQLRIVHGWASQSPFEGEVATSIAISLKRIADAVEGTDKSQGIHQILWEIANRQNFS